MSRILSGSEVAALWERLQTAYEPEIEKLAEMIKADQRLYGEVKEETKQALAALYARITLEGKTDDVVE